MIDGPKGIEALLPELAYARTEAQKKRAVAEEFLSLFLRELVKTMNDTAEGMFGKGFASEVYRTLFEVELARALAKDNALKEPLLRQFRLFDEGLRTDSFRLPIKEFLELSDNKNNTVGLQYIAKRQQKEAGHED